MPQTPPPPNLFNVAGADLVCTPACCTADSVCVAWPAPLQAMRLTMQGAV